MANPFHSLPDDIIEKEIVEKNLRGKDLSLLAQVDRRFHTLSEKAWKSAFHRHYAKWIPYLYLFSDFSGPREINWYIAYRVFEEAISNEFFQLVMKLIELLGKDSFTISFDNDGPYILVPQSIMMHRTALSKISESILEESGLNLYLSPWEGRTWKLKITKRDT
jgi:hypothetical protein